MARTERSTEPATPGEAPREARGQAPSAPAMRTVAPSTSVDASSEVEGRLRCRQTLRIDGRVRGEIECEKAVLVGEGARVEARIEADEVQISGVVEGDIAARRKITLERTAVVTGDLTTPGIVIEEGAKLKGRIVIGSDDEPATDAAAKDAGRAASRKAQPAKGKAAEGAAAQPGSAKPDGAEAPQPVPAVA